MMQYLLSVHAGDGPRAEDESTARPGPAPEEMQAFMDRVVALEDEMESAGVFVFGGTLHDTGAASVVRGHDLDRVLTDGPFVEAKEHIAGFYVISAEDLDAALGWAGKVVDAIGQPIEVRPFRATGRVRDHR